MELWTIWLLLKRDGRRWKNDFRAVYDGALFWRKGWRKRAGRRDTDTRTGRLLYGIMAHGECEKLITLK